jgi:hypothetical protein
MEIQGYYEDEYAKTPQGWKFKSRVHNVPSDFRSPDQPTHRPTTPAGRTAAPAPAK